jgi:hypothetical protein
VTTRRALRTCWGRPSQPGDSPWRSRSSRDKRRPQRHRNASRRRRQRSMRRRSRSLRISCRGRRSHAMRWVYRTCLRTSTRRPKIQTLRHTLTVPSYRWTLSLVCSRGRDRLLSRRNRKRSRLWRLRASLRQRNLSRRLHRRLRKQNLRENQHIGSKRKPKLLSKKHLKSHRRVGLKRLVKILVRSPSHFLTPLIQVSPRPQRYPQKPLAIWEKFGRRHSLMRSIHHSAEWKRERNRQD